MISRRKVRRKDGLFRHVFITCLVAAAWVVGLPSMALGQLAGSASITGTVMDPSGSTVPGAAVTGRNTDTGIDRRIDSNEAGIYAAPFLPPGHYEVRAAKTGFAGLVQKDLVLQVGQTLTVDFSMID